MHSQLTNLYEAQLLSDFFHNFIPNPRVSCNTHAFYNSHTPPIPTMKYSTFSVHVLWLYNCRRSAVEHAELVLDLQTKFCYMSGHQCTDNSHFQAKSSFDVQTYRPCGTHFNLWPRIWRRENQVWGREHYYQCRNDGHIGESHCTH
jgi:hypothetical protein